MTTDDIPSWGAIGDEVFRDLLGRRGLDPENPPEAPAATVDPFREQAEANLAATIPARFAAARADNPRVARWVERYNADPRTAPSLFMFGEPGTGKTFQMLGALRAVVMHAADRQRLVRYRMVTHPRLNDKLRPKADNSHETALDPYEETDLLLLDDLGAGKQTDWTGDCLYRLVDHRWFNSLPTIYATNLDLDALKDAVGDRVVSRVLDGMLVEFTGPDRRGGAR